MKLTSCDVFSSKENIESNIGFYLLLIFLFIFIIIFIIFYIKGYNNLKNKMDVVIYKRFEHETKQEKNKVKKNIIETNKNKKPLNNNKILSSKKPKKKKKKKEISSTKANNTNNFFLNKKTVKKKSTKRTLPKKENDSKTKILDTNDIKPDTDYELNWLSYSEALKYDKRSSCEYYSSLIRTKQLFIFTFCSLDDYNSGIIKKFTLFLSFTMHYAVNALFFTNSNMHQIYEDEGKYNFGYQYPYVLGSALISTLLMRLMLQILVLTDKDVVEVKRQSSKVMALIMRKNKLKCMKIKFAFFFIFNFVLLGLFWYYLTCFNAIYKNTQIYLIENTFISFGLSSFYPFVYNLIPMIIRISALHSLKKDQKCLYEISKMIQIL